MKVNIGYQKEKLREEYYKEKGHYHLDNPKMYFNWLEEKIVKNLAIHDVVVPKGTYCECKREYFIKRQGIKEYCSMCEKEIK